jgi:hypothetical protein
MLKAALVTLKQHRFEVGVAALAGVLAGLWGLAISIQIDALGVSQGCLESVAVSEDGSGVTPDCLALVRQGSGILGETFLGAQAGIPISVMGALPFLVGLLGGIPIVAREIEARTAQTAWSLSGSRLRWLARQAWPIVFLLGGTMSFAALVAAPVVDAWVSWGHGTESWAIGLHGPLALGRAFAAFGVGLMAGAIFGRTLPAFLAGIAISLGVLLGASTVRDAWLNGLDPVVIGAYVPETGELRMTPRAVLTGWGVETPDGELLSSDEGRERATRAGVPPPAPGDEQDTAALEWYAENGFVLLPVGVTDEIAVRWAPYDGAIFVAAGILSTSAAAVTVNRRRPA